MGVMIRVVAPGCSLNARIALHMRRLFFEGSLPAITRLPTFIYCTLFVEHGLRCCRRIPFVYDIIFLHEFLFV